jgi:hypothetical protein
VRHDDETVPEFHLDRILESQVSDLESERCQILLDLVEGGPIRLLLTKDATSAMLAALSAALGTVSKQDYYDSQAAKICLERERKRSRK